MAGNDWTDLLSDVTYTDIKAEVTLRPYQTIWLTNRLPADTEKR